MICSIHDTSQVQSIKTATQYGQGGALSRTRSPKNSHSYMPNITPSPCEL